MAHNYMASRTYFYLIIIVFLHTTIQYQVFLFNRNNLHTVISFQIFLSNTNNSYTILWSQVIISI